MAKKQTFGDKVNRSSEHDAKKYVKVIRTLRSKRKGSLKFNESMFAFDADKSPDSAVKEFLKK